MSLDFDIRRAIGSMLVVRCPPSEQGDLGLIGQVLLDGELFSQADLYSSTASFSDLERLYEKIHQKALLCIDHEGGRIHRLKGVVALPTAYAIGLSENPENAYRAGQLAGRQLKLVGVNTILGPVLDIAHATMAFPARCFGESADKVIEYARAYIQGLRDQGMFIFLKHAPGHGAVEEDSHFTLPHIRKSYDALLQSDLKPFQVLASEADGSMPCHVVVEAIDPSTAATFSKKVISVLNGQLIISDSMTMKGALENYQQDQPLWQPHIDAIKAGCNLLTLGRTSLSQAQEILEGIASEASSDSELAACILTSARKIEQLLQDCIWPPAIHPENLTSINFEVRAFAEKIAHSAVRKKNEHHALGDYHRVVVLAPDLLKSQITEALEETFTPLQEKQLHTWQGTPLAAIESPSEAEIANFCLPERYGPKDLLLLVTYKAEIKEPQRALFAKLFEKYTQQIAVCEAHYSPPENFLSWLPEEIPAICTYSEDANSLRVGFQRLFS